MRRAPPWRMLLLLAMAFMVALMAGRISIAIPDDPALRFNQATFFAQSSAARVFDAGPVGPVASTVSLPHDWRRSAGDVTESVYLIALPHRGGDAELYSVWIPRLSMNAQVYLNGHLVGLEGSMQPPDRHWNRSMYWQIPRAMLATSRNQLAIHVVAERAGQGLMREVYFGSHEVLGEYADAADFFSQTLLQFIVLVMLLVAMFITLLWWWGKRDRLYGRYASLLLAWALHDAYPLVTTRAIPGWLLDAIWHVSLIWFVWTVCRFVFEYLDQRWPWLEKRLLLFAVVASVTLVTMAWISPRLFYDWGIPIVDTSTLIVSFFPLLCVGMATWYHFTLGRAMMVLAGALEAGFGVHDWLIMIGVLDRFENYLMPYGSPAILLVFGIVLTRRFGQALDSLASMNSDLEATIRERERSIAAAHWELARLQTEKAVAMERERLARDMHDGVGGTLITTLAMARSGSLSPDSMASALQAAIEDLRLMIDAMDPVGGNLVSVLASLRARLAPRLQAAGLQVRWNIDDLPDPDGLDAQQILHVMRILQEGINNVLKHAQASQLTIDAGMDPQHAHIWLELVDDGCGIPSEPPAGRGMVNMLRRAQVLGAHLTVQALSAGQGTRVRLTLNR